VTIEVQCTSCHTRYRIDEQVLPEGTPTFKCSRCGHVFNFEPRGAKRVEVNAETPKAPERTLPPESFEAELRSSRPGAVKRFSADTGAEIEPAAAELAIKRPEPPRPQQPIRTAAPPRAVTPPPQSPVTPRMAPVPQPASPVAASPKTPVRPAASSEPPSHEIDEDPLSRPFSKGFRAGDNDFDSGENLAFDFQHEGDEPDAFEHNGHGEAQEDLAGESAEWEVGDPDAAPEPTYVPSRRSRAQRRAARPAAAPRFTTAGSRAGKSRKDQNPEFDEDYPDAFADEGNAPVYNRRVTRSARFFLGLFALLVIGYGLMTMFIRSSPAAAAELLSHLPVVGDRFELPVTPARMVALRDVRSGYIRTRDGHTALLITGSAQNVGGDALHTIQIAVNLRDPGRTGVASSAVYCGGDSLSPSMVAKMTPHELAFFQKLTPPKSFVLEPSSASPFVIVFVDPPKSVSGFDLSIATAIPAGADQTDSPDSSGV
jgi:predicted Zn finger-like uncharacterized protein